MKRKQIVGLMSVITFFLVFYCLSFTEDQPIIFTNAVAEFISPILVGSLIGTLIASWIMLIFDLD